jgi:hypothetical protein
MTVRKIGRRWMLLGSAGALAIPALPSLLRGVAKAQDVQPRRMVVFMTEHGGTWQPDMFPEASTADTAFDHPLHRCFRGALSSREEGSDRVVSNVLRAPSGLLTESLVSKMNVMRGLDVPFYYGHARHILGNYGDMSNNHGEPTPEQATADQVMAHSSSFYDSPPRRRLMNFSSGALSVEPVNPAQGFDSALQPAEEVDGRTVFESVYVPEVSDGMPMRTPPIDDIHESFRRLENGTFGAGARLGSADRRRLSEYMDRLSDIRSSFTSAVAASCSDASVPDDFGGTRNYANPQLVNQIIMAGFLCDSSRIAVIRTSDAFSPEIDSFPGGYHEVAHQASGSNAGDEGLLLRLRGLLRDGNRNFFREGVLDLVRQMDGVSEGDGTMLDQSLVWWSPESGSSTHNGDSIPIVSFGSVGGALQTGQYLDLRNREETGFTEGTFANSERVGGGCYFQWTTTYLDAFGIPRSEWQRPGRRAFSAMVPQPGWFSPQSNQADQDASCDEALPLLT